MQKTNKPVAVLIADIHYNVLTLPLADNVTRQAIKMAKKLKVSLIIAGDLHDSKSNLRGECVNAMLKTFKQGQIAPYVLVGNHCKINEKSEEHSLNFLEPHCHIVDKPIYVEHLKSWLIPYQHDLDKLKEILNGIPKGSRLIMHQGCHNSNAGHYIQDKTALFAEYGDFRVISGHYHARQDIKTGRPQKGAVGLFSYIGNPYTLNYGEAKDPSKGYQVLYEDGTLEFIPTNLRRHVLFECGPGPLSIMGTCTHTKPEDIVKIRVTGTKEELLRITKEYVRGHCFIDNFSLELIQMNSDFVEPKQNISQAETLDNIIDSATNSSEEQKNRLKNLWRALYEN